MTTIRQYIEAKQRVVFLPYSNASKSVRLVRDEIKEQTGKKLFLMQEIPADKLATTLAIRWGNNRAPAMAHVNTPRAISMAVNKLQTLTQLHATRVPAPIITAKPQEAAEWLAAGSTVVARHVLDGHSGKGVQIIAPTGELFKATDVVAESWLHAKLFTEYFPKSQEFRVFCFRQGPGLYSTPIIRRKRRANDVDEGIGYNKYVRTHNNGWNFCKVDMEEVPDVVRVVAQRAAAALGLHFCAVDIGYNKTKGTTAVFEVNTAPGLEGETVKEFTTALLNTVI